MENKNTEPGQADSLSFFVELEADALDELFSDAQLTRDLQRIGARLVIGLIDLSPQRAGVVSRLNQAGIPLTAWLLLPKEDGYWFNLDNPEKAVQRYRDFRAWSALNDLRWEAVGLDIEPDINSLQTLRKKPLGGLIRLVVQAANPQRLERARSQYNRLVEQIRGDGYRSESYQLCFIVDERQNGTTLLQRLSGIVDLVVDTEVLMLYSSFVRPYGAALLESYAGQAGGIGIGSTGGGVQIAGIPEAPPLTWEELERDLLLAHRHQRPLYIFSLEGCLRQGFLPRLAELNWQRGPLSAELLTEVEKVRRLRRRIFWVMRNWRLILAGGLLAFWLVGKLFRPKRKA